MTGHLFLAFNNWLKEKKKKKKKEKKKKKKKKNVGMAYGIISYR